MALILLVEDNRVTAEMMRVRLVHAGHEVVHAWNGCEALQQLEIARPDLILLEMLVPELDGTQILRHVKHDAVLSSIPVLVVSARSQEEDILAALAAGADDYITKPVSLRELLARVDRVLSKGPAPLRIAVQGESGPVTLGELVAADARSASVRFHREGAPRFAIGDAAKLSMSSPSLSETIELTAKVRSRGEGDPHRTYEFALQDKGPSSYEHTRAFLDVIGRRGAFRATLDPEEAVSVQVVAQALGESHELMGTLLDISTGGLRLQMKATAERLLHLVDVFEMRFKLPASDTTLMFSAAIRHRAALDEGVAYGVRFDSDLTPDFLEQVEQVSEFIVEHVM